MSVIRDVSENVARKTSRRGLFGRGATVLFGALAGAAAGTAIRDGDGAQAGLLTVCAFPGPPCPCEDCQSNGVCAKPCVILTTYYATGCWVTNTAGGPVTCCDCTCPGVGFNGNCGCGSDYHNNPVNCPA
jgi:hypothetical protein